MAITSNFLGRVILTEEDAVKFREQVRDESNNQAAKEAIDRGIPMAKAVRDEGKFVFSLSIPSRVNKTRGE